MPAQHSQIYHAGQSDRRPFFFRRQPASDQLTVFCPFQGAHAACMTAACSRIPLCFAALGLASCLISYLHVYIVGVCSECSLHTVPQHVYICQCFTQKPCIFIRSPRPFRGSNPSGCDFPPLVLRG